MNHTILLLIFVMYLLPILMVASEVEIGTPPQILQPEPMESFLSFIYTALKLLFAAVVISFIVLPFEILGTLVFDKLKEKYKLPNLAHTYLATYISTLVAFTLFLVWFQWVFTGLLYLIYWA